MSTVAIVVVVVGACIGVVVSYATRWLEDATDGGVPERGRHAAHPEGPSPTLESPLDEPPDDLVDGPLDEPPDDLVDGPLDEPPDQPFSGADGADPATLVPEKRALGAGRRPTVRERRLAEAASRQADAEAPPATDVVPTDVVPTVVVASPPPIPDDAVVSDRLVAGPMAQPVEPVHWWERIRSAMALTAVSVVLGIIAAAVLGVALVALFSLLRNAVG